MKKRILSLLLATIMLFSLALPALAEEGEVYAAEEIAFEEPASEAEPASAYEGIPTTEEPYYEEPAEDISTPAEPSLEEPAEGISTSTEPSLEEPEEDISTATESSLEEPTAGENPAIEPYVPEEILVDDENLYEDQTEASSEIVTGEDLATDSDIGPATEESVIEEISPEAGEVVEFLEEEEEHEDSLAAALEASGNIKISDTFPDENFRDFVSTNFDTNSDGQLSSKEISAVKEIQCKNTGIESLKGIKVFSSLTTLDCRNNALTSLDLSGCTKLEDLNCGDNLLTSLNVSGCTSLTFLGCGGNQFTSLNVSTCKSLYSLECWGGQLTNLNVKGCTSLVYLICNENQLTKLDVSSCTSLQEMSCERNKLTSLIVKGCESLYNIYALKNQLTSLNISGCTHLIEAYHGDRTEKNGEVSYIDPDSHAHIEIDSGVTVKFEDEVEEQTIDESGVLKQGSGWKLLWKCYGTIVGNPSSGSNDLTLEIAMEGTLAESEVIMINSTGVEYPWFEIEDGIDKDSFTHLIIRGTPSNRLFIHQAMFQNYTGLKDVKLDCIDGIAPNAFEGCSNLEQVDGFDEYLISIGESAFKDCTKLRSVAHSLSALPENLETIGDNAFEHTNLEEIYLMEEVAFIGENAFKGCEDKVVIYCYPYTLASSYAVSNRIKYELLEEKYTSFRMYKDSWNFINLSGGYDLSYSDEKRLLLGSDNVQRKIIEYFQKQNGGHCRGMSAAAVLVKMGLLSPSDFENSAQKLFDVSKPAEGTQTKSLINYYHLTSFLYNNIIDKLEFRRLDTQEQLKRIETLAENAMTGGAPFLLQVSNHSVVGYGVKHAYNARTMWQINGKKYDSKIKIYDPNNPKKLFQEFEQITAPSI